MSKRESLAYYTRRHVNRFGPNPARDFYQLDQRLLWDPNLVPLDKLIIVDLLHRERANIPPPSARKLAESLGVAHNTVRRRYDELEVRGYILSKAVPGGTNAYVVAWPPIPAGHPQREEFVEVLEWTHGQLQLEFGEVHPGEVHPPLEAGTPTIETRDGKDTLVPLEEEENDFNAALRALGLAVPDGPPKKEAAPPKPGFQPLQKAFEAVIAEYSPGHVIKWGKEGPALAALAKQGITAEQFERCYREMKAERFWRNKTLSCQSVEEHIHSAIAGWGDTDGGAGGGDLQRSADETVRRLAGGAEQPGAPHRSRGD